MDNLNSKFQEFLNDGARMNILSEEFKQDVESVLGEVEEPRVQHPPLNYRPISESAKFYSPDPDVNAFDDCEGTSPDDSLQDPFDDDTRSILGDMERIISSNDLENQWEGASHIIWTSPGIYKDHKEFNQARNLLKSVLKSINKYSGTHYTLNLGKPDTLFITNPDSFTTTHKFKSNQSMKQSVDEDTFIEILKKFESGIKLKDKDEPGKYLLISTSTPGFSESELRDSFSKGNKDLRRIMESIWRGKGRWTYIQSSYSIEDIETLSTCPC